VGDNGGEIAWIKLNSRRLALISKECTTGLTDAEAAELAVLQDAAAKASEPQDRKLLERLTACEEQANWRCAPMPAETSRACLRLSITCGKQLFRVGARRVRSRQVTE